MNENKMIGMIERKFESIEDKLRNSFQAIKKDKEKLEKELSSLQDQLNNMSYSKEISELRVYFQKEINLLKERVFDAEDKTKKLDSKLDKQDLKGSVKRELESIFDKKFDKELERQRNKVEDEKNEILVKIKQLEKSFDGEIRNQESKTDRSIQQAQDSLEKLQVDFKRKIADSRQESLDEIQSLKRQIAYLKGRVGKEQEAKPTQPNVFSRLVDGLADEEVKVKKIVTKPLKKTVKSNKKGFLTKVVDSLAD
jgi:DNA repair exonuclease SbcCD ATPase subunit